MINLEYKTGQGGLLWLGLLATYFTVEMFLSLLSPDVDSRELVDAWLVNTTGQEPSISRAFQISLSTRDSTPVQKVIVCMM